VAFEVDDLQPAVDGLAADRHGLVGGIGRYEHIWRMAYIRMTSPLIATTVGKPTTESPHCASHHRTGPSFKSRSQRAT
jgi:hypothetical protein